MSRRVRQLYSIFQYCTELNVVLLRYRLATCVRSLLPAQIIVIMQMLHKELLEHYVPASAPERSRKRMKTGKNGAHAKFASLPSTEVPVLLLSLVAEHSHISEGQRKAFDQIISQLYSSFIEPTLHTVDMSHGSSDIEEMASKQLYPALALNLSLLKVCPAFWRNNVTTTSIRRMLGILANVSEPKISYLKVCTKSHRRSNIKD